MCLEITTFDDSSESSEESESERLATRRETWPKAACETPQLRGSRCFYPQGRDCAFRQVASSFAALLPALQFSHATAFGAGLFAVHLVGATRLPELRAPERRRRRRRRRSRQAPQPTAFDCIQGGGKRGSDSFTHKSRGSWI